MALTTRPSQRDVGRTAPGVAVTMARQPRRTPSSAANGISSALAPEKPTTSHGNGACAGLDRDPRADRHGEQRPGDLHHQSAHADHAAKYLDAVEFGNLFGESFHLRSQPCSERGHRRISGSCTRERTYGAGNYLFTFNPVFTRIVNDCVTVLGTNSKARLPGRWGESLESVSADS